MNTKMTLGKRILSVFLTVIMVFSMVPLPVVAAEADGAVNLKVSDLSKEENYETLYSYYYDAVTGKRSFSQNDSMAKLLRTTVTVRSLMVVSVSPEMSKLSAIPIPAYGIRIRTKNSVDAVMSRQPTPKNRYFPVLSRMGFIMVRRSLPSPMQVNLP